MNYYNFDLLKRAVGNARSLILKILQKNKTKVLLIDEADLLIAPDFDLRTLTIERGIPVVPDPLAHPEQWLEWEKLAFLTCRTTVHE